MRGGDPVWKRARENKTGGQSAGGGGRTGKRGEEKKSGGRGALKRGVIRSVVGGSWRGP